jgi:hypothetical protein
MKYVIFSLLALTAIAVALSRTDYGFYNPPHGVAAAGREEAPADPHAHELLQLAVREADITRDHGHVTLTTLSHFYGTDDSLRCSVKRSFNSDNPTLANRPLTRGTTVTLCLN